MKPQNMTAYAYQFNAGQCVFNINGKPTTQPSDTIALCIDKEQGGLLKHGNPESVRQWHCATSKKMHDSGLLEWSENLVVVERRFPLEEVNRCIGNMGYTKQFLIKLYSGEIQAVGYGDDGDVNPEENHALVFAPLLNTPIKILGVPVKLVHAAFVQLAPAFGQSMNRKNSGIVVAADWLWGTYKNQYRHEELLVQSCLARKFKPIGVKRIDEMLARKSDTGFMSGNVS